MPTVSVALNTEAPEEFQELEVNLDETLYDQCEEKGLELPHGCLAGSCGSCRIEILEGSELLKPASVIEQNTIDALKVELIERYGKESIEGKEIRLSCRARITTEGHLKFRPFK